MPTLLDSVAKKMYPTRLSACVVVLFVISDGVRSQSRDGWNADDDDGSTSDWRPQPRPKYVMTRMVDGHITLPRPNAMTRMVDDNRPQPRPKYVMTRMVDDHITLPRPNAMTRKEYVSRRTGREHAIIKQIKDVIMRATSGHDESYDIGLAHRYAHAVTRTAGPSDYKPTPSNMPEFTSMCPPGFQFVAMTHSCYKVIYEEHNWTSADQRCRDLHHEAHLVAITNRFENRALETYLRKEFARNSNTTLCQQNSSGKLLWTSGRQMSEASCKEPFVWKISDTIKLPLSFTHWRPKEPNCLGDKEHCIHLTPTYANNLRWNDLSCSELLCPLCETEQL